MNILLTGASGHLGSAVFRRLLDSGFQVRATDRFLAPQLPARIELADLLDPIACYRLVDGIDVLIHLANHPRLRGRDAQGTFNENVTMNMNIFEAACQSGVKKILYASSIQACTGHRPWQAGQPVPPSALPYLPLDGQIPPNPGNAYGLSKAVGEMMLRYYSSIAGLQTLAIRFPWLCPDDWISRLPYPPDRGWGFFNLDEAFTVLAISDAAQLILACLKTSWSGFRIYLPAAQNPTIDMPLPQILQTFYPNVPLRKPLEQLTSLVDNTQIERDTGWRPQLNPAPPSSTPSA